MPAGEGLVSILPSRAQTSVPAAPIAVRLQNVQSRNEGKRILPESVVEVIAGEMARCDFALETGLMEGVVQGLGTGEKAGVGVFPGTPDPREVLALATSAIEEMMATYMETSGAGKFQFDDIPPGLYSLGVIALPATREDGDVASIESDVVASLAAGRYAIQPVEIVAGEVTTLDVALPR